MTSRTMEHRYVGFTLIELLVVIAIIVVLVGLLLPGLKSARDGAKVVREMAAGQQLMLAYQAYANEYRGHLLNGLISPKFFQSEPGRLALYRALDQYNRELAAETASKYPWRLAPYVNNYDFQTIMMNRDLRSEYLAKEDRPKDDTPRSRQFALSRNPTFGINGGFVGGDAKVTYSARAIERDDQVLFPTRLLVFASSRGYHADTQPTYIGPTQAPEGAVVAEGWYRLSPPRSPVNIGSTSIDTTDYDDPKVVWNPMMPPKAFGWLDMRYSGKAVCVQFDGHAELLGLVKGTRTQLRDMRRWANDATTDDWVKW